MKNLVQEGRSLQDAFKSKFKPTLSEGKWKITADDEWDGSVVKDFVYRRSLLDRLSNLPFVKNIFSGNRNINRIVGKYDSGHLTIWIYLSNKSPWSFIIFSNKVGSRDIRVEAYEEKNVKKKLSSDEEKNLIKLGHILYKELRDQIDQEGYIIK